MMPTLVYRMRTSVQLAKRSVNGIQRLKGLCRTLAFGACLIFVGAGDDSVPRQLCSSGSTYCVKIVPTSLPGSNPYNEFYTIVIARHGNILSKFPTQGYLINALWSPDGKYVAVNNRRANSGDYLWIFRLSDGKPLKRPRDEDVENIVSQVTHRYSQFAMDTLNRRYTLARRWKNAHDLEVRTKLQFFNLDDAVLHVDEVYTVQGEELVPTDRQVEIAKSRK